jgi:putative molybdopterin biosynthesis protein
MIEDIALTPQEVADILKIAKNTVYELIKRGELNGYKVGKKIRVDFSDVEEYKNKTKHKEINISKPSNDEFSLYNNCSNHSENIHNNDFVICGQDILLDILSRYLELHPQGVHPLRSYTGSYNGLTSLYHDKVQVATAHLWDSDSDQYNIPYIRRLIPGIPTVVINIAYVMLGFYVIKGNPKKISSWEDLKRPDIKILNREKGSGTRILLDEHLRLLDIDSNSINGYNDECLTHLAAASTVARGGADVALGNEKTSFQVSNVDFIPLAREKYDLVIKKSNLNKPPFKAIIEILKSESFKRELIGIGGYDISSIGSIVTEL